MGSPLPPGLVTPDLTYPAPYTVSPPPVTGPYTAAWGTGQAGNATPQFSVIHNVAAGDVLVAAASTNSVATAPAGFSDSQNNSYQLVAIDINRSPNVALFLCYVQTPLAAGTDTFTLTAGGTATVKNVFVRGYSNVSAGFALDQVVAPQDANTTAPAISSAALGYPNEWAIVAQVNGVNGGVPPQGGWTGGFAPAATIGPGPYLTFLDQLVTTPAALATSNTLPANGWSMLLITLAPVPMINPLGTLAPPGLSPPVAFQPSPLYDTMQGPPPAPVPGIPPVPVLLRRPTVRRGAIWPAGAVPEPQAAPPPPPPAAQRRRRPRLAASAQAPAPGAVSQPLPAASPSRRQPFRFRPVRRAQLPQGLPPVPVVASRAAVRRPQRRSPAAPRTAPVIRPAAVQSLARRALRWLPWRRQRPAQPVPPPGRPSPPPVVRGTWDVSALHARWQAEAGAAQWQVTARPARWQAELAAGQWAAAATLARWRAILADFDPIAAISQEAVPVTWVSELAGVTIDPTNPLLVVEFAFPVSSGSIVAPAEPVTWYPAAWVSGTTSRGFVAECPVGPGTTGPTLTAGQKYDVWSHVLVATSNTVAKFAGVLTVY